MRQGWAEHIEKLIDLDYIDIAKQEIRHEIASDSFALFVERAAANAETRGYVWRRVSAGGMRY